MNAIVAQQAISALSSRKLWITVAVAALVFLAYKYLWPLLRRLVGNVPDDAPYFAGGGDVLASFWKSRDNKIDRLYTTLKKSSVWSDGRCDALKEAASWNDNQLIAMHNAFKNKYGKTLYDAVDEVYGDDCGALDFNYYDSQVKDRLSGLGLV